VLIPSGGTDIDTMIAKNAPAIPWLRDLHSKGSLIAGVCTGVAILAEAGILDGHRATTHWAVAEFYRQRYPKVDWQPRLCVTEDRGIVCGGGVYASIDLALYIVEKTLRSRHRIGLRQISRGADAAHLPDRLRGSSFRS
jgi:transcriptional regulator GlxA family with amidase domain